MRRICIGVDPGFDALKVVSPKRMRRYPSLAVKKKDTEDTFIKSREYISFRDDVTKKTWVLGEYAKQRVFGTKDVNEVLSFTETRFQTEENKVIMLTGIGLALLDNGYAEDQHIQPFATVVLPHKYLGDTAEDVRKQLLGRHRFSLKIGGDDYFPFDITLEEDQILITSQAYAAMMSACLNNEGEDTAAELWEKSLLIFDGGFYTINLLAINAGEIANHLCDSNTELSMINAYKETAARVSQAMNKDNFIHFWDIDYILNRQDGIVKGDNISCDIRPILDETVADFANETINYLNITYKKMRTIDNIIVTGGTGIRYFDYLVKAYGKNKVILSDGKAQGTPFEPVFAIAVGAYRMGMFHLLDTQQEAAVTEENINVDIQETEKEDN